MKKRIIQAICFIALVIFLAGLIQNHRVMAEPPAYSAFEQYRQQYVAINNRFGLGGGCSTAKELGATWVSDWGNGSQYANQAEEDCQRANGLGFFYTVGGDGWIYSNDANNPYKVSTLEQNPSYLADNEDRDLYYNHLIPLLNDMVNENSGWSIDNVDNHKERSLALSSFLLIPRYAKDHPRGTYAITTEPERTIVKPSNYAKLYNIFYRRVKKYDPSAKVAVGKLTSIQGGDWTWINQFRDQYKTLYGSYPPIDIWAVNPYEFSVNPEDTKLKIGGFHDYLVSIGEGSKPLWFTEYGVAIWEGGLTPNGTGGSKECEKHNCLTEPEREEELRKVSEDYMLPIFVWLNGEGATLYHIERWFWTEYFDKSWFTDPTAAWWLGNIAKNDYGEFNPQGIIFQKSTRQPILANKGFESSILKPYGWWFWDGATGKSDYSMTMDTNEKHNGRTSVKIHVGSDPGPYGYTASVVQTIQSTDYAGKNVQASTWCKTADNGMAGLKINITHADGTRDTYWTPSVVSPSECLAWKQISTPWVLIPDDIISLEIDAGTSGQNGTVWFDDFNLEINSSLTPTLTPTPILIPPTPTSPPDPVDSPRPPPGLTATSVPPTLIPGDLTGDNIVKYDDIDILKADFGNTGPPGFTPSDINKDGIVDIFDYNIQVENFGK